jgi:hypothetical protein
MNGDESDDGLFDDEEALNAGDELELAMEDCGQNVDGDWCDLLGTEHCAFRCPFRDAIAAKLTKPDDVV